MKTLRYILIVTGLLSLLSLNAQTPRYGKPYKPSSSHAVYQVQQTDMPAVTMSSTGSGMMRTGSTLPQAAVTGVVTTANYSPANAPGSRRVGEDEGWEDEDDPENPANPFPMGDAMWPLMVLACAYAGWMVLRRRKKTM